ncbi:hypothetical protein AB0395_35170 [Streptosporangium sp. NPDC051023]|uniref:hypothetical protein n=1 Tax=Streptosporangium sp. NPDC051023 TaxID=3155410 RepID=UPI00344F54B9
MTDTSTTLWDQIPRSVRTYLGAREPYFDPASHLMQFRVGAATINRQIIITGASNRYAVEVGQTNPTTRQWHVERSAADVTARALGETLMRLVDQAGCGMPIDHPALEAAYDAISPATRSRLGMGTPTSIIRDETHPRLHIYLDDAVIPGRIAVITYHPAMPPEQRYSVALILRRPGATLGNPVWKWLAEVCYFPLEAVEENLIERLHYTRGWLA